MTTALEEGEGSASRPGRSLSPGKEPVPIVQEAGQRVIVGRQLSEEVRVTSEVPRGSVLGPLLFLVYIKDIWRKTESTIRLYVDNCVIYKELGG